MKNRTLIGIICIILAFALFFVVLPLFNKSTDSTETVMVIRAKEKIEKGALVTEGMIEAVEIAKASATGKELKTKKDAIGMYATCSIFPGDALTAEKLAEGKTGAAEALYNLSEGEFAVTLSSTGDEMTLSGQLQNGDIVRIFLNNGSVSTCPDELRFVRVITTVTSAGKNRDTYSVGDGSDKPSAVMFAVNEAQAQLLFANKSISCAFICHGDDARAESYLAEQKAFFETSETDERGR